MMSSKLMSSLHRHVFKPHRSAGEVSKGCKSVSMQRKKVFLGHLSDMSRVIQVLDTNTCHTPRHT